MKFHEARVDIVAETRRLEKELSKVEQDLSNAEQQLSNERFLSKAPPNVIEGVRKRAKELAAMREKTRNELNQLR